MKIKTKINKLFGWVSMLAILVGYSTVSASGGVEAFVDSTIAGYPGFVETTRVSAGEKLDFLVKKPDGNELKFSSVADDKGQVDVEIFDYHTRVAGEYQLGVSISGKNDYRFNRFEVFPDEISNEKSVVELESQMVNVNESVDLNVVLKDQYGNAISGHEVMLVSSRGVDEITKIGDGATDGSGAASFRVQSTEPGLSTITAYDLTAGVSLDERAEMVFFDSAVKNIGGDLNEFSLVPTAYAQSISGGPVNGFEIDGLDGEVSVNENFSFTVKAVDEEGNVSENYSGEVRFSVEGASASDVILPDDYQFEAQDLGAHTFSLGISFKTVGTYKVVVTDVDDFDLRGEQTVVVTAGDGVNSNNTNSSNAGSSAVVINSPKPGTYNVSSQQISGTATPGVALKIYDNDQEIGNTDADSGGDFSFQTGVLSQGEHKFQVVALGATNSPAGSSEIVTVVIDTAGPDANLITFDPNGPVAPGSLVEVSISSDNNLSQAALLFDGKLVVLTEDIAEAGTYKGSFLAPNEIGTYGVDVILVDGLGNESQLQNEKQIVVAERGAVGNEGLDGIDNVDQIDSTNSDVQVDSVTGLKAYSGNERVNLEWSEVDGEISNYRVYYGERADSLTNAVDTFTEKNEWYVPNLENGKEYFFALTAIDSEGNESPVRSEIVSAVPFMPTETGVNDSAGDIFSFNSDGLSDVVTVNVSDLKEAPVEKPALDETGPEIYYLMLMSLFGALFYTQLKKI